MTKKLKAFDVVQVALDATYAEVPGDEDTRDETVAKHLEEMSEQYRTKLMTQGGPDFNQPQTRFGYVFRYVPAHAHWVYELLVDAPVAQDFLKSGKARMTCIGGGPGSDVVGTLKYLDENDIKCQLFCEIIDGCEMWKTTWGDLAHNLDWKDPFHTDYVIHNVKEPKTWDSPSQIRKADIVTLSFFVSEIFHLAQAKDYLSKMLGLMKPGAVLLLIDNRTPEVYGLMDAVAAEQGFEAVLGDKGMQKIYDPGESKDVLAKYTAKFGSLSKLQGEVARRVYRKRGA